jgi:hypothetical protein
VVLPSCRLVFVLLLVFALDARGAEADFLDAIANEIKAKRPFISGQLLVEDKNVISGSLPAIRDEFRIKGFSHADVNAAVSTGWKDLRSAPTPLRPEMFKAKVMSLGKLRIESVPGDADIHIDGSMHDEKTDTSTWLTPGTYRIRVTKEGYRPEEERRRIVEGNNAPVRVTLQRR